MRRRRPPFRRLKFLSISGEGPPPILFLRNFRIGPPPRRLTRTWRVHGEADFPLFPIVKPRSPQPLPAFSTVNARERDGLLLTAHFQAFFLREKLLPFSLEKSTMVRSSRNSPPRHLLFRLVPQTSSSSAGEGRTLRH